MTKANQNDVQEYDSEIKSKIRRLCELEGILENIPKSAWPIVKIFWNRDVELRKRSEKTETELKTRIEELESEKRKLNRQIAELQNKETELRETRASERTERKITDVINRYLRRQLRGFYALSVIMSLALVLSDILIDLVSTDLGNLSVYEKSGFWGGIGLRSAGIVIIAVCAFLSWLPFRNNKEQVDTTSQDDDSEK